MARIAGVDIPREKRLVISLTYVFGIGRTTASQICASTGIDESTRTRDLTDASWKHTSTDGEIFTLIRVGSKDTGTRGDAARMKSDDIWNVVNYLRTLGPAKN